MGDILMGPYGQDVDFVVTMWAVAMVFVVAVMIMETFWD